MATEQQLQDKFAEIIDLQKTKRNNRENIKYPDRFIKIGVTQEDGYQYEVHEFKKSNGDVGLRGIFRNDGETQTYHIQYLLSTDSTTVIGWIQDGGDI